MTGAQAEFRTEFDAAAAAANGHPVNFTGEYQLWLFLHKLG